ncbi:MAG TPA: hypothetical protein PKK60_00300, partial [archaeon]|nr:hypothetical protein [archaeon]
KIIQIFIFLITIFFITNFVYAEVYDGTYNAASMTPNVKYPGRGCAAVCSDGDNGNRTCCSYDGYTVDCEDRDNSFCEDGDDELLCNGVFIKTLGTRCTPSSTRTTTPVEPCTDESCHTIIDTSNARINPSEGCFVTQNLTIDNVNYSIFATPGAKLSVTNIETQRSNFYDFYLLDINPINTVGSLVRKTNATVDTNPSESSGTGVCVNGGDGCLDAGTTIGKGTKNNFQYTLPSTNMGGYNYKLKKVINPKVGTYESNIGNIQTVTDTNIFVGMPSLIISGPNDTNGGFYEKFDYYEKAIYFTLINTSPFDINLNKYSVNCTGQGVECTINQNYVGWTIDKLTGKMVIYGTIKVNKSNLPINPIQLKLDVNYIVPQFLGKSNCTSNYNTSSKNTYLRYGLLDYQKFQVGLIAGRDFSGCVGEDGMIGQTGKEVIPRINIGFGGNEDLENKLISIDECDIKDINGEENPKWVYCSKKELLVELTRKIISAWKIQEEIYEEEMNPNTNYDEILRLQSEKEKYLTFEVSIRKQGFSTTEINSSIENLINSNLFTNKLGLEEYNPSIPSQKEMIQNLFEKVKFTQFDGEFFEELQTGTYKTKIKIQEVGTLTSPNLFNSSNELNENIEISVDFYSNPTPPKINWFFYNFPNEDFNNIQTNPNSSFKNTNLTKRGKLLSFIYIGESPVFNNYEFTPNYATPIMVRLTTDNNANMSKAFSVSNNLNLDSDTFSYWTAYASSVSDGCTNITSDESLLPYREGDKKSSTNTNQNNFYFNQFDSELKPNSSVYLQTILFWPTNLRDTITINGASFEIYTKNLDNNLGSVKINEMDNNFSVINLEDIIEGIKNQKICVNYSPIGTRNTSWTIFWNTKSVYDSINGRKIEILNRKKDANLCLTREILGG